MICVSFDPDNLPQEQAQFIACWKILAKKAFDRRHEKNGEKRLTAVWGELKRWLLKNYFHGKCCYCEVNVEAGFVGDAEHYRPKGGITEKQGDKFPKVKNHPGYHWLILDPKNLAPSCQRCNSVDGKRTQFPVQARRVREKDGTDFDMLNQRERPLLLHPYRRDVDPKDHLVFTPDGGVEGLDDYGWRSIEVLDLDRKGLCDARAAAMFAARNIFANQVGFALAQKGRDAIADIEKAEKELTAPHQQFSAAIRDELSAARGVIGGRAKN